MEVFFHWTALCPTAQASDTLAELLKKQQATEGGAAGKPRVGKGVHGVPSLAQLFHVGQLVRCVVTELQDRGSGGQGAPSLCLLCDRKGFRSWRHARHVCCPRSLRVAHSPGAAPTATLCCSSKGCCAYTFGRAS